VNGYGAIPDHAGTGRATSGPTIAALVCSLIALVMCCNLLAVPAIVTSAMAIGRSGTDPASAQRLTTWSWGVLVLAFLLPITAFLVLLGVDAGNAGLDDSGL
jgi:hypothetical protein